MNVSLFLFIGIILAISSVNVLGSDTRQKCITGLSSFSGGGDSGGDGGGLGGMEADEFGGEEGMMGMMGMMGEQEEGGFGMGMGMMGMGMDMGMGMGFGMGMGEADEGPEGMGGGFGGVQPAVGSLSCPKGDRGSILIKRVRYGASAFPGACQNIPFCEEKFDAGVSLATQCDGKSTCPVNTLKPKILNCGRNSNYMLVEYECVDTWATFEICETVSTVARGASVLITSPGYLGTSKPGTSGVQMCECIIQSQNKADMYLEYLQTQLVSEGKHCPYEYILIESKKNITQPGNDEQLEVCGQRHVKGQWFPGTLRLTYASGGPMQKRGLLAKFTVDNLGLPPKIQIECGKVNSKGVKLQERPRPNGDGNSQSNSGSIPASGGFGSMGAPPWAMNNNFGMGMPMFPPFSPMMPKLPVVPSARPLSPSGRPPPAPRADKPIPPQAAKPQPPRASKPPPDFSKWNIKVESSTKTNQGVVNFANAVFKTQAPPARPKPKAPGRTRPKKPTQRRPPNKKSGAGKVMGNGIEEEKTEKNSGSGGMVALVFGGIGSVLIIGSVGIFSLHNYRKRQRIKRKEAEYASGGSLSTTYGKGWDAVSQDSVYATVKDVDLHRGGCINPAVVNDDFGIESAQKLDSIDKEDPSSIFGKCSDFGTYDTLNTPKDSPKLEREVAVIEVHRSFDSQQDKLDYLNDEGCQYAKSGKSPETNRCTDCNIERPPRRKDKDNGYDNNVGINRLRN